MKKGFFITLMFITTPLLDSLELPLLESCSQETLANLLTILDLKAYILASKTNPLCFHLCSDPQVFATALSNNDNYPLVYLAANADLSSNTICIKSTSFHINVAKVIRILHQRGQRFTLGPASKLLPYIINRQLYIPMENLAPTECLNPIFCARLNGNQGFIDFLLNNESEFPEIVPTLTKFQRLIPCSRISFSHDLFQQAAKELRYFKLLECIYISDTALAPDAIEMLCDKRNIAW